MKVSAQRTKIIITVKTGFKIVFQRPVFRQNCLINSRRQIWIQEKLEISFYEVKNVIKESEKDRGAKIMSSQTLDFRVDFTADFRQDFRVDLRVYYRVDSRVDFRVDSMVDFRVDFDSDILE